MDYRISSRPIFSSLLRPSKEEAVSAAAAEMNPVAFNDEHQDYNPAGETEDKEVAAEESQPADMTGNDTNASLGGAQLTDSVHFENDDAPVQTTNNEQISEDSIEKDD